ncbi:hypothetical protein [Helicobacter bilis]|uniref:hypothetical protein n=1 Tax=Helicobacter bilis TaxID=37372 RepID=UPI002A836F47|nr:hypothetical protein [Helicobacter bilis]MDY4399481.1 hypothetical protein [Helicobacter bilis]
MQHTKTNKINEDVESALESWDFDKAYTLYKDNITQDSSELKMDFCVFLHDIGKFDELLQFIKADSKNNSDALQCPQFWDNAKLNWGGGGVALTQTHIEADTATLYENFQLKQKINPNFLLNRFIAVDALTADIAFCIMQNYMKDTDNKIIRNYFLKNTLQYFYKADIAKQQDFFTPVSPPSFTIFLKLINEERSIGAAQCYRECIGHYRNILLQQCKDLSHLIPQITAKPHTEYKKFAICLYGILRGDYIATLEDIITNLAIPLNADVFLFTWDMQQVWPGLCGWTNWVMRMLEPTLHDEIPDEIAYHLNFHEFFPNTYKKLNTEYLAKLDKGDLESLQKKYPCFKHCEIVNQDSTDYEGKTRGGAYHFYYGIYRIIEMMKQYEVAHNITYDFIFTLRNDGDIKYHQNDREATLQELQECESNEIFDTLDIGASNISIYGPRDVMLSLASLYNFLTILPDRIFPDKCFNNHVVTFVYLTMCGVVKNRDSHIEQQYARGNKCQMGMSFPDIRQELQLDLNEITRLKMFNNHKIQSFTEAFEKIRDKHPFKDVERFIAKEVNLRKNERLKNIAWRWYVAEEENRYIPPQDLKPLFKVIKFMGKYFPNAKVRRQARRFTDFFNFLYKKVYGKHL